MKKLDEELALAVRLIESTGLIVAGVDTQRRLITVSVPSPRQ